jgi:hypothetical protein
VIAQKTVPVTIPGGPEIVIQRSLLGSLTVMADGSPVARKSWRQPVYQIRINGMPSDLRITGQYRGLQAQVNGLVIPLERRLATWETVLSLAPFGLIAVGGLIGAVIASVAVGINTILVRRIPLVPIRAAVLVVVAGLSFGMWYATVRTIVSGPNLAVGTCLNGVHEGAALSSSTTHVVACASAHDSEVVGTYTTSDTGAYPGQPALVNRGDAPCRSLFTAYVGTDLDSSRLTMLFVVPTARTWADGARQITCLVVASNGAELTGSVLGSGR